VPDSPILGRALTAAERAMRQAILRAVYLERLKEQHSRELLAFLNGELFPELTERLATRLERAASRGYDRGPVTTQRFKNVVDGVRETLAVGKQRLLEMSKGQLSAVAVAEARAQVSILNRETKRFGVEFDMPPSSVLRELVTSKQVLGRSVNEWLDGIRRSASRDVLEQLRLGIAQGESTDEMVRRVRGTIDANYEDGVFEKVRRQVVALVRTSTNFVTNHAREATFAENDDIVKGVKMVAVLDTRTSAICQAIDGQVFPVGEGPRPPFHPNCRTQEVPVLKSWKELGLGDRVREGDERLILRESMDGEVPGDVTYEEWLRDQPADVQDEVLGPTRASMWRSGEVANVRQFVDDRGRPMTLDELDEKLHGSSSPA
jgi:SPP1 gp7 family putative phage head morphogenesis protein